MADVRIFFKKASDFKVAPVSGAWGGLTPQGYLYCELFFERAESPESVVMSVDVGPPKEIERSPKGQVFVRESMVGLTMHPEIARVVGEWMIKQADELRKNLAEGGKG